MFCCFDLILSDAIICASADQVYVSGLSQDVTEEDLASHFGSIGMLKEDKKRGKPKIWLYRDKATSELKARPPCNPVSYRFRLSIVNFRSLSL